MFVRCFSMTLSALVAFGAVGMAEEELAPPINDACADAVEIGVGQQIGDSAQATTDGAASCVVQSSKDVWYKFVSPFFGPVVIDTLGSSFDTVLSLHTACPGTAANETACDDDSAGIQAQLDTYVVLNQELYVRLAGFNNESGAYVLNVAAGGTFEGRVTAASDGSPVPGWVATYDADGNFRTWSEIRGQGRYTSVQPVGDYFALTANTADYLDQVYDGLPCVGDGCDVTLGTPVGVTANTTLSNVDFVLVEGGVIEGTLTNVDSGDLINDGLIEIYDAAGELFTTDRVIGGAAGMYRTIGLPAGDYFVRANVVGFADELHQDFPCEGGCDVTLGTPVSVTLAATSTVDFELAPAPGTLTGQLTVEELGDGDGGGGEGGGPTPIEGVTVEIYDEMGMLVATEVTDPEGFYTRDGLSAGSYFLTASATGIAAPDGQIFIDELHSNLKCHPGGGSAGVCDPTTGRAALVVGETTTAVDIALTVALFVDGFETGDASAWEVVLVP